MEPSEHLSATTAIIGLLTVGGKTIDILTDLNTVQRKETAIINLALQDLKQCRSSIHILYKSLAPLESTHLPYRGRERWIQLDYLIATLTDIVLAFTDLHAISGIIASRHRTAEYGPICLQYTPRLRGLCSRLRWNNLSLTMMTTILMCPGEADAHDSLLGLERRMKRLLGSNAALSKRMDDVEDVYGATSHSRGRQTDYAPMALQAPRLPDRSSSSSASSEQTLDDEHMGGLPAREQTWSIMTGLSLGDVCVLSTIPIPITVEELQGGGGEYYTFGFAQRVSQDLGELMHCQAGQGTSKVLAAILGKQNCARVTPPLRDDEMVKTASESVAAPPAKRGLRFIRRGRRK